MNGRSTVLILFLWALLTVITPTLVRMSASAKLLDGNGSEAKGKKSILLPRRALIDTKFTVSAAPAPLRDTIFTELGAPASEQARPDLKGCTLCDCGAPASEQARRDLEGCTLCDCGDINILGPCFCCMQ